MMDPIKYWFKKRILTQKGFVYCKHLRIWVKKEVKYLVTDDFVRNAFDDVLLIYDKLQLCGENSKLKDKSYWKFITNTCNEYDPEVYRENVDVLETIIDEYEALISPRKLLSNDKL